MEVELQELVFKNEQDALNVSPDDQARMEFLRNEILRLDKGD